MIFRPYCIAAVIVSTSVTFSSAQSAAAAASNTPSFASVQEDDEEPHSAAKQNRVISLDITNNNPSNPNGVILELGGKTEEDDKASLSSRSSNQVIRRLSLSLSGTTVDLHHTTPVEYNGRKLSHLPHTPVFTGTKTVVGVRVETTCGDQTTASAAELAQYIFDDAVNLATQYKACSHDKLNIIKAPNRVSTLNSWLGATNIDNGIVTAKINQCVTAANNLGAMSSTITSALENAFSPLDLDDIADHFLYCLPPGSFPSGSVVAVTDQYISLYEDEKCNYVAHQMYGFGNANLNFGFSGKNGALIGDATCAMGASLPSLSDFQRCFNPAKSWESTWFTDKSLEFNPNSQDGTCFSGPLYGTDSYGTSPNDAKVLIRLLSTSGTHFHVGFNGRQGSNSWAYEDRNKVLIITQADSGDSQKIAALGECEYYTISDYDGSPGRYVTVAVASISGTDHAEITITCGPETGTVCSSEPSSMPSWSSPPSVSTKPSSQPSSTVNPSQTPSDSPSLSPSESLQPSSEPSLKPSTSVQPSSVPSDVPSSNPSADPSQTPSDSPSFSPSVSLQPSSTPSAVPSLSLQPSSAPSDVPSSYPSADPSQTPSDTPSSSPSVSLQPSSTPSAVPSLSLQPSSTPSITPSETASAQPSSAPSDVPSSNPSADPSQTPSDSPSLSPSKSLEPSSEPSSKPSTSVQPSSAPSEVPSSNPSADPSQTPSDSPSLSPSVSLQPSSTPSAVPSLSLQPSSASSNVPSDSPSSSSMPSENPSTSFQPSSGATEMPSSATRPSSEPSTEVSGTPSCGPSAYPTEAPSTESGIALWYPKWTKSDEGCFIDGNEPEYMTVNPTEWLSTTLQKCCDKYFSGYYYDQCLGKYPPTEGNCAQFLYYPDWHGSNEGCVDDGKEPLYMLSNKDYFLSNSLLECCEKFYGWKVYDCTGTSPVLTNGEFYPDWEGGDDKCTKDGAIPTFMLHNQNYYLSATLEDCCEKHFQWKKNECMGGTMTGTNKWYVVYRAFNTETCLQDCVGSKPCGGLVPSWQSDELFETQEECCDKKLYWKSKRECILNSRSN